MAIGSVASSPAVPLQVSEALDAITQTQAAELQVFKALEQGAQVAAAPVNPGLGQIINLSV